MGRVSRGLVLWCLGAMVAVAQEPGAAATEGTSATPSGEYLRDLKTVEASVQDLKERVFQSKATLQLLHELVVEGVAFGAGVRVWHVNQLPKAYAVERADYFLDGKSIFTWQAERPGDRPPSDLEVADRRIEPGTHTLQVVYALRGNGGGVFNYVKDYAFNLQSVYSFTVEEGEKLLLRALAVSRGGVKTTFVERPTLVYEERVETMATEGQ